MESYPLQECYTCVLNKTCGCIEVLQGLEDRDDFPIDLSIASCKYYEVDEDPEVHTPQIIHSSGSVTPDTESEKIVTLSDEWIDGLCESMEEVFGEVGLEDGWIPGIRMSTATARAMWFNVGVGERNSPEVDEAISFMLNWNKPEGDLSMMDFGDDFPEVMLMLDDTVKDGYMMIMSVQYRSTEE